MTTVYLIRHGELEYPRDYAETHEDVMNRMMHGVREVARHYLGKTIGIVSYGVQFGCFCNTDYK